jgi:hypothetical protein
MYDLGYPVALNAVHGPTEGTISSKDATVRVERHAEGFTRVRIRIGTFETADHHRRADLVFAGISSRLGAP